MIFPLVLLLSLVLLLFGGVWAQIVDTEDEEDGNWLRCGLRKELICHHPSNDRAKTFEVCVSAKSVPFHLEHGDTVGPCVPKIIPCPETCDETCPTACQELIGSSQETCTDGIHCWDLNKNAECDLASEDTNMDGVCDIEDCQGTSGNDGENGLDCWDINQNHICDLNTEDINQDQICSSLDCQGPAGDCTSGPSSPTTTCLENVKICCYVAVEGNVPPSSGFPMLGEIIWPAWNDCSQQLAPDFLPCLGQFLHNPALCALILDRYGPGNSTDCSLPDFSGMKTAQYAL